MTTASPARILTQSEDLSPEAEFQRRRDLVETAIDRFGTYLEHYLFTLTENRQDAEDLFQDLMIYVMTSFDEEKILHIGKLKLKAYHLFVDYYRKKIRRQTFTCAEPPEPETVNDIKPDALSTEEEAAMKARFFEEHPIEGTDEQLTAFWLFARYGYTFKEISQQTGTPPSTIGDWISLLRQRLADLLNKEP